MKRDVLLAAVAVAAGALGIYLWAQILAGC